MSMRVMIIFVMGMRTRHDIGGERRKVVTAVVGRMAVIWVVTRAMVRVMWC